MQSKGIRKVFLTVYLFFLFSLFFEGAICQAAPEDVHPPSMTIVAPVMAPALSEARKAVADAMSSGEANLAIGMPFWRFLISKSYLPLSVLSSAPS